MQDTAVLKARFIDKLHSIFYNKVLWAYRWRDKFQKLGGFIDTSWSDQVSEQNEQLIRLRIGFKTKHKTSTNMTPWLDKTIQTNPSISIKLSSLGIMRVCKITLPSQASLILSYLPSSGLMHINSYTNAFSHILHSKRFQLESLQGEPNFGPLSDPALGKCL